MMSEPGAPGTPEGVPEVVPEVVPSPAPGTGPGTGGGRRRRSGRYGPRVLAAALAFIVLVIAAGAAEVLTKRTPGEGLGPSIATAVLGTEPTNILLIGNNARGATSPLAQGQGDILFLVHVDPVKHEVVFISIPRDTLVAYPQWNDPVPKIKSAFYMGGPQLAMQTASRLVGMPVQGYVVADFQGFAAAINAVGGLEIDIQYPIYDPIHSHAVFKAGLQHLNGADVLAYIRVRQNQAGNGYRVNDFQRMSAAYGIMGALKKQVLTHLSPGEIGRLLSIWQADAATNLNQAQLAALAATALHAKFVHLTLGSLADSMQLPTTALPGVNREGQIDGAYYDVISSQEIERQLAPYGAQNASTGLPPLPAPSTVKAMTGNPTLLARLKAAGINAQSGPVPSTSGDTVVLYPPGDLAQAEVVGRAVAQSTEVLEPSSAVSEIEVEAGG